MRTDAEPSGSEPAGDGVRRSLRATVVRSLANGMFRLRMQDGREVIAHTALDLRKAFTRLLPGDPVVVELSPFDPGRARICSLIKSPQHSEQHSHSHQPESKQQEL